MIQEAKTIRDRLVADRRWLHAHAETGFDLQETREYVRQRLTDMGYTPRDCGQCGLIADIGTGEKTFLLRADMDALPIREESGLDFAAGRGSMHACGHDLHTAMLLGAAQLLKNHESELHGRVRLMFQSAEELLAGAADMIAGGALKGVDAAMMIHATVGPLPVGTAIVCSPGVSAPGADFFTITVHGKSCHGSAPQNGVDPILAAAHLVIAIQSIQTRELGLEDQAVMTVGSVQGGTAANIIADTVTLQGSLRAMDERVRQKLKVRLVEISRGISDVLGAEAKVFFDSGCPCLKNDAKVSVSVTKSVKKMLGTDRAFTTMELSPNGKPTAGGSEDFAYVSQQIPAVMVALAAGDPGYPLHHPKVRFDEDALPYGAAIYAQSAMDWLQAK